jgi:photosystem II stability/assembly factor-like uncharacterized protein
MNSYQKKRINTALLSLLFGIFALTQTYAQYFDWTTSQNQFSGTINTFAGNDSLILCATDAGNLYQSTNNGLTWQELSGITGNTVVIKSLARIANFWFAGTSQGIYLSSDNAQTWSPIAQVNLPRNNIRALMANNANLYAAIEGKGVFMSSDMGRTWIYVGLQEKFIQSMAIMGNIVFVGTSNGELFRTDNNGLSWIETLKGRIQSSINTLAAINNTLYVDNFEVGVDISRDSGRTWQTVQLPLFPRYASVRLIANIGETIFIHTFYPPNFGYILVSNDKGNTWNLPSYNNFYLTALYTMNNTVFAGRNDLYISQDFGKSWTNPIYPITNLPTKSIHSTGNTVYAVSDAGKLYRSLYNSNWNVTQRGMENVHVTSVLALGTTAVVGTTQGTYRSLDYGTTWNKVLQQATVATISNERITTMHLSSRGISYMYAGTRSGNIYESIDTGFSWRKLPSVGLLQDSIVCIGRNESVFVATTQNLFRLELQNQSWIPISTGLSPQLTINTLSVSGNTIILGTTQGVFLSEDNATTWIEFNRNLPNLNVTSVLYYQRDYYCSVKNYGVYIQSPSKTGWFPIGSTNLGLSNLDIRHLHLTGNSRLFAATAGGIFSRNIFVITSVQLAPNIPPVAQSKDFDFNTLAEAKRLSIHLTAKPPTTVSIQLFDIFGNVVFHEPDFELVTNEMNIPLNTEFLPIGTYFVKVSANKTSVIKKCLLFP